MKLRAQTFISAVLIAAVAACCYGLARLNWSRPAHFGMVLLAAVLASRLKVKLPGVTGFIAFNLPLLLLASVELDYGEAVVIAAIATSVACFPFSRPGRRLIQSLFNVAMVVNAVSLSAIAANRLTHSRLADLTLPSTGMVFFVMNTIPVAFVITLTEDKNILRVWGDIFKCSFPNFVLSTGLAAMAFTADRLYFWQVPIATLIVMLGTWHCYRYYFARAVVDSESQRKKVVARAG